MARRQIDMLLSPVLDSAGDILNAGTVQINETGAGLVTLYAAQTGVDTLSNPVTLGSDGTKLVFVDGTVKYDVLIKNSDGDTIWDYTALNLDTDTTGLSDYLAKDGSVALTGNWAVGGFNMTGLGDMTSSTGTIVFDRGGSHTPDANDLIMLGGTSGNFSFRADDVMTIYDDGTAVMTLDASQNVGVGTESPGRKFTTDVTDNYDGISITRDGTEVGKIVSLSTYSYLQLLDDTVAKVEITANGDSYINGGNVGIGTASPDDEAALDVDSATGTKAIRLPRATTVQRDAMDGVAGLLIYNTTTNKLNICTGAGTWEAVTSA